jgi:hypothetical protein
MPKVSVNEAIVDQRQQARLDKEVLVDKEVLTRCRAANLLARIVHERASEKSAFALRKLTELDRRCALLISRLSPGPTKANYQCERMLRILTRVDQAEALANEVLAADIGANIDALAEKLAKVMEDIGFSATEILGHQRNIHR